MKEHILANINKPSCLRKKDGVACMGKPKTVFGRSFDAVCTCRPYQIFDPSADDVVGLKKLVLAIKERKLHELQEK